MSKEAVGELASVSDVVAVEGGREENIDVKLIHKRRKTALWAVFRLVEDIGVEPMTPCMPCKYSSQLS